MANKPTWKPRRLDNWYLYAQRRNRYRRGIFTPAKLFANGEPGVWYDPSDLTTLFQDDAGTTLVTAPGDPVGKMLDKSGNGYHATQSTAAARPTYQTDGTYHWLEFDGVDDFLVTPTITPGTDKVQVFAGARKLSDAAAAVVIETSTNYASNNGTFILLAPQSASDTYRFGSVGTTRADAGVSGFAAPITNVLSGLGDISGDSATVRVDGTQGDQTTSDQGTENYLTYPLYIGARAGTSLYFNGHIYSLVTRFGPNLDTATIEQTETYVADKTGVTL